MSDISQMLWATAIQSTQDAGMTLTVPCAQTLKDFIQAGVRSMQRQQRVGVEDIEKADMNLFQFMQEMILAMKTLDASPGLHGKIDLREAALVEAKRSGPFWPFY